MLLTIAAIITLQTWMPVDVQSPAVKLQMKLDSSMIDIFSPESMCRSVTLGHSVTFKKWWTNLCLVWCGEFEIVRSMYVISGETEDYLWHFSNLLGMLLLGYWCHASDLWEIEGYIWQLSDF